MGRASGIDSPDADEMRRSWEMFGRRAPDPAGATDDVNERIVELLDRFDAGEAGGFWESSRLLTVRPGSRHYSEEFNPDVTSMPRWSSLAESDRERFVDAADRYLRSADCDPDAWVDDITIRHYPSDAGYRALIMLLRIAPERLAALPQAVWHEWAPVLACFSTGLANGAKWEDKKALLDIAGPGIWA